MGLPENIDALLVKFDITQDQLARVAGVHPSSVARWRTGSQMRHAQLAKICEYFDLSEDDLLSTENGLAAKEHGHAPMYELKPEEGELLMLYRGTDDRGRAAIMAVARSQQGVERQLSDDVRAC